MTASKDQPDIRSLTQAELASRLSAWGEPGFRCGQILDWLYAKRAADWPEMGNLPKPLRARLSGELGLFLPALHQVQGSSDTTRKFLWRLADGAFVESVLIPANPALYGEASDRHTLCVSTQVGCAYGCRFCASGLDGWKRNLRVEEIVGQILSVERWHAELKAKEAGGQSSAPSARADGAGDRSTGIGRIVDNLVIMGMGEPLANYDHLIKALGILNAPWGAGIGARRITISTSGLAPQIRRLADEPIQYRLAVSLHGATDEVRNRIMPVNRKYPLAELTDACEYYQERKGRMLTLEYILIAGVNDAVALALPLAALAKRLHAKVNLIPYNPVEGLAWRRPDELAQEAFFAAVERRGVKATLRREKGGDIDAACGQLRLRVEKAAHGAVLP